jgi:hypothetical protein
LSQETTGAIGRQAGNRAGLRRREGEFLQRDGERDAVKREGDSEGGKDERRSGN